VALAVPGSTLEGLYDEPRPGAPAKVTDAQVEHVWKARRAGKRIGLRAN
jgi:hypothetical protein